MFEIHPKALATFRFLLSGVVLWDLFDRAQELSLHYGVNFPGGSDAWSLHNFSSSNVYQSALFVFSALLAVAAAFGFGGAFVRAALWLMTLSLQHRNLDVLFGADAVLRLLLFWNIFLPHAFARLGVFAQIVFIYFSAGLHKIFDVDWLSGVAIDRAFSAFRTPLGMLLRELPALTAFLCWVVIGWEILVPLIALFCARWPRVRTASALAMILFNFGLMITLDLGFFPLRFRGGLVPLFSRWILAVSKSGG